MSLYELPEIQAFCVYVRITLHFNFAGVEQLNPCKMQRNAYINAEGQQAKVIQVNEKFKKGHTGIVEKAQETSSDSDNIMHNTVCLCHCCTS